MAETNSSPITTERSDGYVWTVRPEPEIGPQTLRPEEATGITVARERAHGPRRQRVGSDDILQLPGRAGPPVYHYRGLGTPSHGLGRIHPYV